MIDRSHDDFLRDVAERLRELSWRAPDIMNELRRFADDIDELIAQRRAQPEM